MRIAFLVDVFPALSTPFINNQITGLLERGHEVDIYALERGDVERVHPDVEKFGLLQRTRYAHTQPRSYLDRIIHAAGYVAKAGLEGRAMLLRTLNVFRYGRDASRLKLLYRSVPLLPAQPYDIIHAQFGNIGLLAQQLREVGVLQGKLIVHFRGYDISAFVRKRGPHVYRDLFRQADLLLANCDFFKRRLMELGASVEKITVHRSGIDCDAFAWEPKMLASSDRVRVLTVGRLSGKKGIEYAIRGVAELISEGVEIEYNIIGDGPLRPELEALITQLGVGERVHLLGRMEHREIIQWLKKSHLFAAPSITSPTGDQDAPVNVLKEAMACGLPVVATWHGGIPELVEDGVSGYLAPERDSHAIARLLKQLLASPERWADMGRAGRAKVESEYDTDILNEELVQLYQSLLTADVNTRYAPQSTTPPLTHV